MIRSAIFLSLLTVTVLQGCIFSITGKRLKNDGLQFPADHFSHPGFFTEWWYFNGHLKTSENKHYSYFFSLFRVSSLNYFVHLSLTDPEENHFMFDRMFYTPKKVNVDTHKGIISYNDEQVLIQTGEHNFRIRGSGHGTAIDLELTAQKPPMIINGNGRIEMPEGGVTAYYSMTRLQSAGTIKIGDKQIEVTGLSWMDHQWGNFYAWNKGWDWFSFQMDDSTDYNIYSFRNGSGKTLKQFANVLDAKNNLSSYQSISVRATDHWKNKQTGRSYVTGWEIILPGRNDTFLVAAQTENQEIYSYRSRDIFPSYWEGSCIVEKHSADGRTVYGRGFSEQLPRAKQ